MLAVERILNLSANNATITGGVIEYNSEISRALQGRYTDIVEIESGMLKLNPAAIASGVTDEILVEFGEIGQSASGGRYHFRLLRNGSAYKPDFACIRFDPPVGMGTVSLTMKDEYGPITLRNPKVNITANQDVVILPAHGLVTGDILVANRIRYSVEVIDVDTFQIPIGNVVGINAIIDKYNFTYSVKVKISNVDLVCGRKYELGRGPAVNSRVGHQA